MILSARYFSPNYSLEHFDNILPNESKYKKAFVPMVSFCDLMITQLSLRHIKDFGKYGIGLKKEWGEKKGVSPVVYVHGNSYPSQEILDLINIFNAASTDKPNNDFYPDIRNRLVDFIKYIKPYKGFWQKKKRYKNEIVYYNEREWRYCPSYSPNSYEYTVFSGRERSEKMQVLELTPKLKKEAKLRFKLEDIKYIIIDHRSEIKDYFDVIDSINITNKELKNELKTKLRTFDEIQEDYI